jgi:hypothetical protein
MSATNHGNIVRDNTFFNTPTPISDSGSGTRISGNENDKDFSAVITLAAISVVSSLALLNPTGRVRALVGEPAAQRLLSTEAV